MPYKEILEGVKDWGLVAGGLIAFLTFLRGLQEYRKNNQIKRTEFFEKLYAEFIGPRTFLARKLLDDFWIGIGSGPDVSDKKLIEFGSLEAIESETFSGLFADLLRDHRMRSVSSDAEQRARASFDDLLDFFTKLEYYFSLKLISKSELSYFRYYIQRCAYKAGGAVIKYAQIYGYPSLSKLFKALDIQTRQ